MIFNKEVSIAEFEQYKEELMNRVVFENNDFIKINPRKLDAEERYKFSFRFDSVFDGLSPEFYGWVGTIINYNEDDFMNLFFRER